MMVVFGLLFLSGSQGASDPAAEVAIQAVFDSTIGPANGEESAHFFCDQEARLSINVSAMRPGRIDLRARLVQLGSGLAAPLGSTIMVAVNEEVGPTSRGLVLRLALPRVKRVSEFELQFSCRTPGEHTWFPAGRARLRIYPPDLVRPLRSISEHRSLLVLDPEGGLKEFLRMTDIGFVDLSPFLPGTAPRPSGRGNPPQSGPENALAIWVKGETPSEHRSSRPTLERLFRMAGTVIVLGSVSDDYPKLKLIRARDKTRVDVEMSLLASLATDPRSQLALVEAVLLAVSPEDPILFDLEGANP